jgi:hypothetical protein
MHGVHACAAGGGQRTVDKPAAVGAYTRLAYVELQLGEALHDLRGARRGKPAG